MGSPYNRKALFTPPAGFRGSLAGPPHLTGLCSWQGKAWSVRLLPPDTRWPEGDRSTVSGPLEVRPPPCSTTPRLSFPGPELPGISNSLAQRLGAAGPGPAPPHHGPASQARERAFSLCYGATSATITSGFYQALEA